MYRRFWWLPLLMISVLFGCAPQQQSQDLTAIIINEVQTSGGEYDWIELHNTGDQAVSLIGCYLTNDPDKPGKWQFPAVSVEAGGYVLIYADDVGFDDDRLCAPFRLNAGGTTLRLSAHSGTILQQIEIPAGAAGLSYGRHNDNYVWFASPTPNADNQAGMLLGEEKTVEQYGLRINEYMSRNRTVLYDQNGDYSDWIEIHNFSNSTIDLSGYVVTDARTASDKWCFPVGTTIPADGYVMVRCSGRNAVTDGEFHTNFKLGEDDAFIGLYTAEGYFCSGVDFTPTEQDRSCGYIEGHGYVALNYPTPGYQNVFSTVSEVIS